MSNVKSIKYCDVCSLPIEHDPIYNVRKTLYDQEIELVCCSQDCARMGYLGTIIGAEITVMVSTLQKIYDKLGELEKKVIS